MYERSRFGGGGMGGGRKPGGFGDAGGLPPKDLLILLATLFVTYSLVRLGVIGSELYLSSQVFTAGQVWRVLTFSFTASPSGSFWFLLELLILFWFGRDVFRALGRRSFWTIVGWGLGACAAVTLVADGLLLLAGWSTQLPFYFLVQGQHALMAILIAAFATLYGNATIYLFFILPVRARWFIGLEILFAFMGFLDSGDFAGFLGICAAVAMTYSMLTSGGWRRVWRDLRGSLREIRLRIERKILEAKIQRMRKQRGMHVVKDDRDGKPSSDKAKGNGKDDTVHRGPWVN